MNIIFYPAETRQKGLSIDIGCIVDALIQRNRTHNTPRGWRRIKLLAAAGQCQICGTLEGRVAIHHVKPIWVYALSLVLSNPPQNHEQSNEMVWEAILDRIAIDPACDENGNLQVLCAKCHKKAESEATKHWRQYFIERYPVEWKRSGGQ